jgi:hypothetical protein
MPGIAVLAVCLHTRKSIACGVFGSVKIRVSCALPDHCRIPAKRSRTRLRLKRRPRRRAGQHAIAYRRPHSSFSNRSSCCILRYFVPAWAAMASADIVADDAIVSTAVRVIFVSSPMTVGPTWAVTCSTTDIPSRTVRIITVSKKALTALKGRGRACFRLALVIWSLAPGGTTPIALDASRESAETYVLVQDGQGRQPTLRSTSIFNSP